MVQWRFSPRVLRTAVEAALAALLAVQLARLLWAVFAPVGMFGDWRPPAPTAVAAAAPDLSVLSRFDPFFRGSDGAATGPAVVTSLDLKLYGVRLNEASGRGSAIIGSPEGQALYSVGDEVAPGVRLAAVAFDHVLLDRAGAQEQLYLDQSEPAPAAADLLLGQAPAVPPPTLASYTPTSDPAAAPRVVPADLVAQTGFEPRRESGAVTGFTLQPRGSGEAFRAAGLQPGDVLVAINDAPVTAEQMASLQQLLTGGEAAFTVDRGGRRERLTIRLNAPQ